VVDVHGSILEMKQLLAQLSRAAAEGTEELRFLSHRVSLTTSDCNQKRKKYVWFPDAAIVLRCHSCGCRLCCPPCCQRTMPQSSPAPHAPALTMELVLLCYC
jgi:hypothetical protein